MWGHSTSRALGRHTISDSLAITLYHETWSSFSVVIILRRCSLGDLCLLPYRLLRIFANGAKKKKKIHRFTVCAQICWTAANGILLELLFLLSIISRIPLPQYFGWVYPLWAPTVLPVFARDCVLSGTSPREWLPQTYYQACPFFLSYFFPFSLGP